MRELYLTAENQGERIDRFLSTNLEDLSRSYIQKLVKEKGILVNGNPVAGYGSHFDMQLMSLCRHNILSNSTYSWWGAYLNRNQEKVVIIPRIWFNPASCEEYTSQKALCDGWTAL